MLEALIDDIAARLPPIDGGDLVGFRMDADHYIPMQPGIVNVSVAEQDLKTCLLRFEVTLSPSTQSLQDATDALTSSWRELAYNDFEASSVGWYSDCALLRFVTVPGDDQYFVSGSFVVRGAPISDLVRAFDRDFANLHGRLQPIPEALASRIGLR